MDVLNARYARAIPQTEMTGGEAAVLATKTCSHCKGSGVTVSGRQIRVAVCNCVYRSIFRICFDRYVEAAAGSGLLSDVGLERCSRSGLTWSFKRREYCADLVLVARRTLDALHFELFAMYYLAGADYDFCCGRLHLDRGAFFHAVYRLQQNLGRAFWQVRPYPLFPPRNYFAAHAVGPLPVKAGRGCSSGFWTARPAYPPLRLDIQMERNHAA